MTRRPPRGGALLSALTLGAALVASACARPTLRPFPARPVLRIDDDRRPLRRAPPVWRRSPAAQVLAHQVAEPVDRWLSASTFGPARNVNRLGEVPRSTWFEDRQRGRPLSADAIRRGAAPAVASGPSLLGAWHVLRAGRDRAGPFLVIRDEDRARYLLRFDQPGHPRLATTASLVSTLLLHALGYQVPERHLVIFAPTQLKRAPSCVWVRGPVRLGRKKRPLSAKDLRSLRRPLPTGKDGSLRAVATRLPDGVFLGPFRWRGTRRGDPNDYVPHERRRELRGLRPIAAWLSLTGITSEVPRDLYLRRRRYVRHLLWHLRGALGSTLVGAPKPLWEGWAQVLSLGRLLARTLTLGMLPQRWERLRRNRRWQLQRYPGLGWLPNRVFEPKIWTPRLRNDAFTAAGARDLHWGARRLASISASQIRAAVAAAYLPRAEARRLVRVLLHRRHRALLHWLRLRAPFGQVRWHRASRRLCVVDLWQREGLGTVAAPTYETRLRIGPHLRPGPPRTHRGRRPQVCFSIPGTDTARQRWGRYFIMELRRPDVSRHPLRIHLRVQGSRIHLAGIEH